MKIVRHERGQSSTIIYMENDEGLLQAHCILDGIMEDRQEVWDLPDDVDPLDLVLVESHAPETLPDPFASDFEANRAKAIGLVKKHRGKFTGNKAAVSAACHLPDEQSKKMRKRLREEFAASRAEASQSQTSSIESSHRINDVMKAIRKGNERRNEELLADEIMAANPELKRVPREDVGLTVKFV